MKVSIITAVRNSESTIAATLDSLNMQDYQSIEHIVVDGASTDGTLTVVNATQSRNIRVVSEPDRGVYDAFSKGLLLCTGDVVGYLNAGDFFSSAKVVSRIVKEFARTSADSVFGDVAVVDQLDVNRIVRMYNSSRFTPELVAYGFMPAHPTLYIRREIYAKYGGYDSSYRIAGDFELIARYFCSKKITYSYIHDELVRMPRGGLSSNSMRSNWIITKEMKRACTENGISTSLFKLALRFPIKLTEWIRPGFLRALICLAVLF